MEMLCDKCIHGYDGAPNIVRPECYNTIIKRDKSDYVVSCSNYKQKPLITVDGKTIGEIFDGKTYAVTIPKDEAVVKPDPPEVPSAYAAANKRINELSGGISYLTEYSGDAYKTIRRYAKEILAQCDLIEKCIKEEQP